MIDQETVRHLMAVYARALDTKDYGRLGECFAQEAVARFEPAGFNLQGRDAIVSVMKSALDPLDVTQHLFGNFIIEVSSDTATVSCDVIAQHVRQGVPGGDKILVGARYDIGLTRHGPTWQMASIFQCALWMDGNSALLIGGS